MTRWIHTLVGVAVLLGAAACQQDTGGLAPGGPASAATSRASQPAAGSPTLGPPATPTGEPGAAPGAQPRYLPRRDVTPGATRTRSEADVCPSAHTSRIRPPASYTDDLKRRQLGTDYAYLHLTAGQVEEDHLIPLELGGSPSDPHNLWPEPHVATGPDGQPAGSDRKDHLENYLHAQVCAGAMSLTAAQQAIAGDWYRAYVLAGRPTVLAGRPTS